MKKMLRAPVESVRLVRRRGRNIAAGVAEVNGWRAALEDEHIMVCGDDWGVFGVCDGHGGRACAAFISAFLESKVDEILRMASSQEAPNLLRAFFLEVDRIYLEQRNPFDDSGCTCTLAVVSTSVPENPSTLVLVHLGDSRALLGNRKDGSMASGGGTDGALTTDHHPDLEEERARIERAGSVVHSVFGTARIDGNLALSRAFGDVSYKTGSTPHEHPVTAVADVSVGVMGRGQFVVLCCDGVTEGTFTNQQTVASVAATLVLTGDPALAARAVCRAAIQAGSHDNVSCMVVVVPPPEQRTLVPLEELEEGPLRDVNDSAYRDAYSAFSRRCSGSGTRSTWSQLH